MKDPKPEASLKPQEKAAPMETNVKLPSSTVPKPILSFSYFLLVLLLLSILFSILKVISD